MLGIEHPDNNHQN